MLQKNFKWALAMIFALAAVMPFVPIIMPREGGYTATVNNQIVSAPIRISFTPFPEKLDANLEAEEDSLVPPIDISTIEDCTVTAYCPCAKCCGVWAEHRDNGVVRTSTGDEAVQGITVAVDPKVIPYGAHVLVNGHEYIAQDCGGFSGNVIDLYFNEHIDAVIFGRRTETIQWYIP